MFKRNSKTKTVEQIASYPGEEAPSLGRREMLFIYLVGIGLASLITILPIWWLMNTQTVPADAVLAPLEVGTGIVLEKTQDRYSPGKAATFQVARLGVVLRIGKQVVNASASNEDEWRRIKAGEMVQVTYRTGKNGQVYVQDGIRTYGLRV